jgi:hypothetical protein
MTLEAVLFMNVPSKGPGVEQDFILLIKKGFYHGLILAQQHHLPNRHPI